MLIILDAIGLAASIIGLVSFAMNHQDTSTHGSRFQIKLGLECPTCTGFSGKIKKIAGYDVYNRKIGYSRGKKIDEGGIWDHHFTQDTPGQQVDYMSLMAGDNGLCISWIIVENPDVEAATGVWTGDVGKYCSQPWYPGNQIAGTTPDGLDWRPACFWLDGDGSPGIPSASMKWSVNAFSPMGSNRTLQENRVCTSTIFSGKKELLEDAIPATAGSHRDNPDPEMKALERPSEVTKRSPPEKRTMVGVRRKPWMEGQIIISEHWNHNATSLCHDEMGYGPDFIGSDGYMCDMDKREVVPVCSFHEADGCVEVDTNTKALIKRSNLMKRGEDTEYKNYEHIALWK